MGVKLDIGTLDILLASFLVYLALAGACTWIVPHRKERSKERDSA